jgi:hypothetical protein
MVGQTMARPVKSHVRDPEEIFNRAGTNMMLSVF